MVTGLVDVADLSISMHDSQELRRGPWKRAVPKLSEREVDHQTFRAMPDLWLQTKPAGPPQAAAQPAGLGRRFEFDYLMRRVP
jgi:hypothetical protein